MRLYYKIICITTSILFVYLFTHLFFFSDSFVKDLGLEPSITSLVLARRASVFMLGIAVLMFLSRDLLASKARQIICLSTGVTLFCLSSLGAFELIKGNINSSILVAITIESVLWISCGIIIISEKKAMNLLKIETEVKS